MDVEKGDKSDGYGVSSMVILRFTVCVYIYIVIVHKYGNNRAYSLLGAEDKEYHAPPVSPLNFTTENNRGKLKPSKHIQSQWIHDQLEVDSRFDADSSSISLKKVMSRKPEAATTGVEVIELDSGSDDESYQPKTAVEQKMVEDPESCVWLISGPDGIANMRRYSLSLLKRWSLSSNYAFHFKVWKEGQSEEQAIPLGDALKLASPLP